MVTRKSLRGRAIAAARSIFLHVVRFCMRQGLRYPEVTAALQWAFVEIAHRDIVSESSRPTNSRIAALTGLSRKKIAEIRADSPPLVFRDERSVPSGYVLEQWHNNPRYSSDSGRPIVLPIESLDGPSLYEILDAIDCGNQLDAVLDELLRSNSVLMVGDHAIAVEARTFILPLETASAVDYFGIAGSNLLSTLNWNTDGRNEPVMFERTAWSSGMPQGAFDRFSNIVRETSKPFLELVDDWLTSHQASDRRTADSSVMGVGVYVFQRRPGD